MVLIDRLNNTAISAGFLFPLSQAKHHYLLMLSGLGMLVTLALGLNKANRTERKNIFTLVFYILISVGFWSVFLLTPTMVMYLIRDFVNLSWHGISMQPQWLDIDPIILVVGAPLMAWILLKLKKQYDFNLPTYSLFAVAMFAVAVGCYFLSQQIHVSSLTNKLPISVIFIYISCLAAGELLMVPEGYTLPSKFAPKNKRGLLTGAWIANISIGSLIAASVSNYALAADPSAQLEKYHFVFHYCWLGALVLMIAVLVFGLCNRDV